MDTTVDELADELAVHPGDIRVVLREHDVYTDDPSDANACRICGSPSTPSASAAGTAGPAGTVVQG